MALLDIANLFKISERTLFRKINSALEEFVKGLESLGYTAEKLELMFLGDYFINSIYTSVQKDVRYLVGAKNPIQEFNFNECVNMVINKSLTKIVI
jgi:hypothetical protein